MKENMSAEAQIADQIIKDCERAQAYTKEYLDSMPEKGYMFKPTPEMRTFSEQMLHLASANFSIAAIASNTKSPYEGVVLEKMEDKSKSATIKIVMNSYDFAVNTIKNMQTGQFDVIVKVYNRFDMPASVALAKMFEHQTHMCGQTTVYLRLKGIIPPSAKLF